MWFVGAIKVGLLCLAALFLLRKTPLATGDWAVWRHRNSLPYGLVLGISAIAYTGLVALYSA